MNSTGSNKEGALRPQVGVVAKPAGKPEVTRPAVSLRQLSLLRGVARLGGVGRAADACGLTQPAATQSLATLAERAGFPVLSRGARGVTLTRSGRELNAGASLLTDRLDGALQRMGVDDRGAAAWRIGLGQLRLINAVHERGTMERAAKVLRIEPRAARRRLRMLEILVDQPLLVQQGGSLILNEAGRLLARHAGRLPDEIDRILLTIREDAGRAARTFVLGVAPDPGTASLNELVRHFTRAHPDWCLELLEAGQDDLLARLVIGEVDLVVGHVPEEPGDLIAWREVARTSYRVVGGRAHPLAARPRVSTEELRQASWIFGARGSQRRLASDRLFADGPSPNCVLVTSAAPMMTQLLQGGELLCLMSDDEPAMRGDLLAAIACQKPCTVARLGIASRSDTPAGPLHDEVFERLSARGRAT